MNERHGGPYDRGSADAWYERPFNPHYFVGDSYNSDKISRDKMTEDEIKAYSAGYEEGMESGSHKEWE